MAKYDYRVRGLGELARRLRRAAIKGFPQFSKTLRNGLADKTLIFLVKITPFRTGASKKAWKKVGAGKGSFLRNDVKKSGKAESYASIWALGRRLDKNGRPIGSLQLKDGIEPPLQRFLKDNFDKIASEAFDEAIGSDMG